MNIKYPALLLTILLASASAIAATAPNTLPKEVSQGASGSCHEAVAGNPRLNWSNPLLVTATALAEVSCSAPNDTSQNGTTAFGGVISNSTASTITVDCKAWISSGGAGPKKVARSAMVSPKTSARITWTAADMGTKTLLGGQAGFTCMLKPGTSLSWIFSTGTSN